ncbi:hypothetical protein, partial [Enhygromyxa salina]|uniref:hypothetical protein n=1 Tax=Enhygromyxa salina TaxID=215803 RepID=UPI0015E772ED
PGSRRSAPVAAPPQIPAPTSDKATDKDPPTRTSRPRSSTIPQLSAPDIAQALKAGRGAQANDEDPT